MRVVVTGAGGQLGLDLLDVFEDAVGLSAADLDVADEPAVWAAVRDHAPDLVVNAAAWTDVDGCEADPARAHRVNALGPWWLARACRAAGAALVSVSTDYVFDGTAPDGVDGRGLAEFDPVCPINAYGRSKAAGEQLVRETLPEHYLVRTAWVCGARGANFVRTMLRLGREREVVRVVDDQVGSPTCTRDLAAAIRELAVSGRYGTYHRTNAGRCSWYDLAAVTFELAGIEVDLQRMGSDELDRPAPRPGFSVLDNLHAEASGLLALPHWRDGLTRLLAEMGELAAPADTVASLPAPTRQACP
ncbi:dTDP-4-dehydrorhamnose reductase [Egicoccus halophilus]|uniref:dTDP-4-dehydrorhamnose reductase n=1 Tax=Egicoccus halophilus TaxID=1670830 RepID=A0A8J3ESR3_9ACTN|nr:dTDP-4-dehydrorhamnose reductase [Egicoccus halophilus]GGI04013.1 NAD(P)-dependent oxidoreductase [Egicoccus halophilus]